MTEKEPRMTEDELSEIYQQFTRGSEGFCRAVESQCGFDLTREQIRAIAKRAKNAEEFHSIWANEDRWVKN